MTGKPIALVTGGASGIGLASVRRLIERGYHVVIIDVGPEAIDAAGNELGADITSYRVDVADPVALQAVVDEVEQTLGPLEYVLGSAGIARVGPTLEVARSDIDLMMSVNYGGIVNLIQSALPPMLERGHGEFAVIASLTGLLPPKKMAAYGATKAAIVSYMQSLRYEHDGKGVTLACVCPAAVSTPMAADFFADPAKRAKSMATTPETIVAAIEKGLRKKQFLILPGPLARSIALISRLTPGLARLVQSRGRFSDLV
ncbi:SDR family oxidoreductase [Nocardia sp. NPDC051463]|uniref:SDR family NAD(P)-dependent oxidoreductase n=1 Tax=Nocardia sp. NPDC051463 TaxID=3154845 RepID=UPI00344CE211